MFAKSRRKPLAVHAIMHLNSSEIRNHNLNRETHVILVVLENFTDPCKPCCWIVFAVIEHFNELADLHQTGRIWTAALACNHPTQKIHVKPGARSQSYHIRVTRGNIFVSGITGGEGLSFRKPRRQRMHHAVQRNSLETLSAHLKIHSLPSECYWGVSVVYMFSLHQFGFCKPKNSPSLGQFYQHTVVYTDANVNTDVDG
jgi:hypothetical protein